MKKHHHITQYPTSFRLRFLSGGQVFDKSFLTLEEAIAARDIHLPPDRSCLITKAEHARQLAKLPRGTDLRGIYVHSTKAGYIVRLNRNSVIHYGGFHRGKNALAEAVETRDALQKEVPAPLPCGRPRKVTYKTQPA